MPNKRISELELLTNPSISDTLPIVNNGVTKKIAVGTILQSNLPISASGIEATSIHVEGGITAESFTIISTSVVYATGSTNFGNSSDDFHTFTGSLLLSGSSSFVGNHILSGTSTLTGNTVISGSLNVSGSSNFHNSIFILTGSTYFSGAMELTGSLRVFGDLNVVSGSEFKRWGNKLFNYGGFSDSTTQSGSADTAYSMRLNTTDFAHETSITSGSRITVQNTGIYNVQFSAQLTNTANTNITFDIWLAYTGSNMTNSNTQIDVNKSVGQLGRSVAAWNWVIPIQANDWVELKWSCNASTGQIYASGSVTNPVRPAIPSVIATITQVA